MKGTVKKYITARGYGFIEGEDGVSYFFHLTFTPDKSQTLPKLNAEDALVLRWGFSKKGGC